MHCASVAAHPRAAEAAATDNTKSHRRAALLLEYLFNLAHFLLDLTAQILGFAFNL
jgi:hypothetical protein